MCLLFWHIFVIGLHILLFEKYFLRKTLCFGLLWFEWSLLLVCRDLFLLSAGIYRLYWFLQGLSSYRLYPLPYRLLALFAVDFLLRLRRVFSFPCNLEQPVTKVCFCLSPVLLPQAQQNQQLILLLTLCLTLHYEYLFSFLLKRLSH